MSVNFRCKKCRTNVLSYPESSIISAHGLKMNLKSETPTMVQFVERNIKENVSRCSSLDQDVFYIQESNVPEWITECLNKGNWTRGKLMCPGCPARLGSYDFVSGFHCSCQASVVPAIHLVKSKVDCLPSSNLFHGAVT